MLTFAEFFEQETGYNIDKPYEAQERYDDTILRMMNACSAYMEYLREQTT